MTEPAVISVLDVRDCRCVRVSPDGTGVLTLGAGRAEVRESVSGQLGWSRAWDALEELPVEAIWGAGGESVTVLAGAKLGLLDATTGESLPIPGDLAVRRNVTALALSPDGLTLAAGTSEGIVLLWQQDTGRVTRLRGGGDPVTALGWRPNGNELCVARPRSIQFWHLPAETMISSVDVGDVYPRRLAWAPDGDLILVAGLSDVRLLSVRTRSETAAPRAMGGRPTGAGFSRTGATLLVGRPDGSVEFLGRQLMRPDVPPAELPANVTEAACLHVNETGIVAARTGAATVTLFQLTDTVLPGAGLRTTVAVRRWAAGVARTAGHIAGEQPFAPVPTVLATRSRLAWADDGGWFLQALGTGAVTRFAPDGQPRWTAIAGTGPLTASPDMVLVGRGNGELTVLDAASGAERSTIAGVGPGSCAPRGVAVVAVGGHDLMVYEADRAEPRVLPLSGGVGIPAWSPDGSILAAATPTAVVRWDGRTLERMPRLGIDPGARSGTVHWSPDGGSLALDRGGTVTVWESRTWLPGQPFGGFAAGTPAWSPDSRLLAIPARDPIGAVALLDARSGHPVATVPPPPTGGARVATVSWAADGRFAVAHADGTVVRWELPLPPAENRRDGFAHPVAVLAELAAATAVAGGAAPLPLLEDLLSLLLGQEAGPLAELSGHPGVALLRGLRWPPESVVGLAVLLTAELPLDGQPPPEGAVREDLSAAVTKALDGLTVAVPAYQPPVAALVGALDGVDDSVLVLANLLGHDAVAAEPDLLARVRRQSFSGWSLPSAQRKLLGLRSALRVDGTSQGHGVGDTRAGIARNGQLTSLLPSQLALPQMVILAKVARDELLFRTREGALPIPARPLVLLLDDTPAAFGAVGVTLRLVANLLAGVAIQRHRRCALIRLSAPRLVYLDSPKDLVRIWDEGSLARPDLAGAITVAESALAQLSSPLDGLPLMVLLTHPYQNSPSRPGLHLVRVHYPGIPVEDQAPRTSVLAPDADPELIRDAIAGILSDRS